jgi:hypothetical protein
MALGLLAGLRVVDTHRRLAFPPPKLVVRPAAQRRVSDLHAAARQQGVDLAEAQCTLAMLGRHQPLLDLRPVRLQPLARAARRRKRPRLHHLRCMLDRDLVRPEAVTSAHVAADRLAVEACRAGYLPQALPRLMAAEHFLHFDHAQLPVAHPALLGRPRRPRSTVVQHPVAEPGPPPCSPPGGPLGLQIGWSHDPANPGSPPHGVVP